MPLRLGPKGLDFIKCLEEGCLVLLMKSLVPREVAEARQRGKASLGYFSGAGCDRAMDTGDRLELADHRIRPWAVAERLGR